MFRPLSRLWRTVQRRIDWFRQDLIDLRGAMRGRLASATPRKLVETIRYHAGSLIFGHRRKTFYLSLLAAVAVTLLTLGGVYGGMYARDRLVERFAARAAQASDEGQVQDAVWYCEWIVWLDSSSEARQLQLAEAYSRTEQLAEMTAIIDRLAPDGKHGYPPAHLLKIRGDLRSDDLAPERLANIDIELGWLEEVELDQAEIDALWIERWLRSGNLDQLATRLTSGHRPMPEARLQAAKMYASLHMREQALRQATLAKVQLAERIENRESTADRLRWAEAAGICGDMGAVEEILRTGSVLHPDVPFIVELARLHLQLAERPSVSASQRAVLLDTAIQMLARAAVDPVQKKVLLYELHLARGESAVAGKYLAEAATDDPATRLEYARFQATRGGEANARALAQSVRDECRTTLERFPHRRSARLLAAEADVFLRQYEPAVVMLKDGYDEIPDPLYATALCRTYLAWWDAKTKSNRLESVSDLELLEAAAKYFPTSLDLAKRLQSARTLVATADAATRDRFQAIVDQVQAARRG